MNVVQKQTKELMKSSKRSFRVSMKIRIDSKVKVHLISSILNQMVEMIEIQQFQGRNREIASVERIFTFPI